MFLNRLHLTHFRNYDTDKLFPSPIINALLGKNGMGKTNVLDAIYYLCLGRSYFSSSDRYVIQKDQDFFRLEGDFEIDGHKNVMVIKVQTARSKELRLNGKKAEKISDHVGRFPCVIVAPGDIQLMMEGSEKRRKFLNNTIVQYDRNYVKDLLKYNRLLRQRNAALKSFSEKKIYNQDLINAISSGMYEPAEKISDARRKLVEILSPKFEENYAYISGNRENCKILYKSELETVSLEHLFDKNKDKDRILTRTASGIHKDDLVFQINGNPLKNFASQGQLKTFVLSLKLAQYDILKDSTKKKPVLLLDDLFDKLDSERTEHLLQLLTNGNYGQIFVSDTSLSRIPDILKKIKTTFKVFEVEEGKICKTHAQDQ